MNKRIFKYTLVIICLFFIGIIPVSAKENCTSVKSQIDLYNSYDEKLNGLDCTKNDDESTVALCNEYNVRKNLVIIDLMKKKEKKIICSSERKQVNTIINKNKDKCGQIFSDDFNVFVNNVLKLFYVIGPILLILFGSLDFAKATASSEKDALKKASVNFAKRVAATILLFLTPVLVNLILSLNVSDKYLSGNAYSCDYKYLVFNKTYKIKYTPKNNSSTHTSSKKSSKTHGSGDYLSWNQGGESWSDISLGSDGDMARQGCLITSIAIQMANMGAVDKNFDPGILANTLKKNGALTSAGDLSWSADSYWQDVAPGVKLRRDADKVPSASYFKNLLDQNNYPVSEVKCPGGMHFLAVIGVEGDKVLVSDPADIATGDVLPNNELPCALDGSTTHDIWILYK